MKLYRLISSTAVAAVALMLPLGLAAPASALDWHPIEGHDGMVLATCDEGFQILSGIGKGRYAEQPQFDSDGTMTGLVLMLQYSLEFVHSETGEVIHGNGTGRMVFDFVNGERTDTGNFRTVTIAGDGWVLKEAGRGVFDLEGNTIGGFHGILDGEAGKLCPYFGTQS